MIASLDGVIPTFVSPGAKSIYRDPRPSGLRQRLWPLATFRDLRLLISSQVIVRSNSVRIDLHVNPYGRFFSKLPSVTPGNVLIEQHRCDARQRARMSTSGGGNAVAHLANAGG